MDQRAPFIWNRLLSVGGIVWVLTIITFIVVGGGGPAPSDGTAEEVAAHYAEHATGIARLDLVLGIGLLAITLFIGGLWSTLRSATGIAGAFAASGLVSGAAFVASLLLTSGWKLGTARIAADGIDPSVVAALDALYMEVSAFSNLPFGLFIACFALAMLRTGAVARWHGAVGLIGGLAFIATGGTFLQTHVLWEILDGIGALLFNVWVLATAVVALRRTGGARPATAVGPTARAA